MENKKMLFFRSQADEANNDGIDDSVCLPASSLRSISPTTDTVVTMYFDSVKRNADIHSDNVLMDSVALTVTQGDAFEVCNDLVRIINSRPHSDGFIVIADDMTTTDSATAALANLTVAAKYAHPSISGVATITIGAATYNGRFPDFGLGNAEPTDISATELSVNTHYQSIAAATAMTLPSAAAGKAGDWITVFYDVAAGNTNAHTYTTDGTAYALGSTIRTASGSHADRIPRADIAVAADNVITITGATNGDGGQGTYLKFVNLTGAAQGWAAEVYVTAQGTGVTAGTAAFS
tara:strand:+ start:105 stop:983 length:879 start_codon:yes stop_codon:yes gene_type:complete